MRNDSKLLSCKCLAVSIFLVAPFLASAQTSNIAPRITSAIDENNLVTLQGNTHPLARPEFDRGAAPDGLPTNRMLLVLKRSATQEAALDQLMEQQQDASSSNFHNWLTPDDFGRQFGPADQDIQTITSWLQSHGFQVAKVSSGRTVIEFSGTAGQVREAFHTTIHKYSVNGEEHWANSSDPRIPMALTPVVAGVNTLHNFPRQQIHEVAGVFSRTKATGAVKPASPLFTFPNPCNPTSQPFCAFAVAPADFVKIYNVPNLLQSPAPATQFNGDGVTIAIVAESDINPNDVAQFRTLFGLPAPNLNVIEDGQDPKFNDAETEAVLDVEWAGAVAPNASIDLVVSQSTEVSLGADLSAQYAVDNNLAPILSVSFAICEAALGTNGNLFFNQLWQQAAAQGITVTVGSGDSGSAVCNRGAGPATFGLAVSGFTSTPFNVSVGGTDFNDLSDFSTFWNTTPSDTPTVASAKGYIPEMTWNDSCTNQEIFGFFDATTAEQTCNNVQAQNDGFLSVTGGSGGKSNCTTGDGQDVTSCGGGYPKPSWQTALTPADGVRDVPDVSLFASNGFNSSFYIICESDVNPSATSCDPNAEETDFVGIGGTSVSTPSFAGIMALVNQTTGSRQGNANYILYKLAAEKGATCVSAASPASTCVFYDIPSGSTIAMPCASGSPDCTVTTTDDQFGVLSGFSTTSGYDLATGLGSVNAGNLVSKWKNFALKSSSTTLTLNSGTAVNITHGQSVPVSIGVTGTGGTPTGDVSLIANTGPNGSEGVQGFTLTVGAVSGSTNSLPGGTNYTVVANYAGDGTFGSSASSPPITVNVAPEASKVEIAYELFDPKTGLQTSSSASTATFGTPALLRVNVTSAAGDACAQNAPGNSGCPTGNVALTDAYNSASSTPLGNGNYALNVQGYAEDQTIDLPGGTHLFSAAYAGDNSYTAPAPGSATLTISPAATSSSALADSANEEPLGTAIFGSSVFLSGTVSAMNVFSSHAPTGTMTFFSGNTQIGTPVPILGLIAPPTGVANGTANLSTTSLPHGQDSITAVYSGDASYQSSTSVATMISVLYATTTSVTTSSASVQAGTSLTFTASLTTSQPGAPAITGTLQFFSDDILLGSSTISGAGPFILTTSSVPGGMHIITAKYSGDTNFATSSGSTSQTVVFIKTTTSISSSSSTITQGSSVTFTATITPAQNGGPALTGFVEFASINGQIGTGVNVSNGQAQIQTTSLPTGSNQIQAAYSGDSNYAGSTSTAITETVNAPPTFSATANPTTIPVPAPGQSGSTTLTFTAMNGFSSNGAATVTPVYGGLPSETTCTPSFMVTIPSNGTTTAMISCLTTAPSSVIPASRNRPNIGGWRTTTPGALALACLFCVAMLALGYSKKQRGWGLALVFTIFAMLAVSAGCGGGGGTPPPPPNPGTPAPSNTPITISLTINGVTVNVPNVTINVQ
jgi:subtilase family serine protease